MNIIEYLERRSNVRKKKKQVLNLMDSAYRITRALSDEFGGGYSDSSFFYETYFLRENHSFEIDDFFRYNISSHGSFVNGPLRCMTPKIGEEVAYHNVKIMKILEPTEVPLIANVFEAEYRGARSDVELKVYSEEDMNEFVEMTKELPKYLREFRKEHRTKRDSVRNMISSWYFGKTAHLCGEESRLKISS